VTGPERRVVLRRAGALADAGRLNDAVALYGALLREEPEDVHALCGLSRCLGKLGRPAEGLSVAGRAAALAPADDWPHRLRSAHLLVLGRPRQALDAARAALAQDPSGFAALLSVFQAQAAMRDALGAAETAARMVQGHPAEPESHNATGRAAMLRRQWRAAEAAFREALRLAPQEPVYQSNLALALERLGRRREALDHFQRAVRTDPGNAAARRQLVHAIDRRLAVAGVGAAVLAGVAVNATRDVAQPVLMAWAAALLAVAVVAVAVVRWWRLRQLDATLRTFYRHERQRWRGLHREAAAWVAGIAATCLVAVGAVAWLSRSALAATTVALVLTLLIRFPGVRLWRRQVLPMLVSRHGALRAP
jgi:tetratricopeptide (TPR) repeat protein